VQHPTVDFEALLKAILPEYGVVLDAAAYSRLASFLDYLRLWNRRIRLVGNDQPEILVRRHTAESLYLSRLVELRSQTLIDIGSGAGFPGLVLQFAYPNLITTLVESNSKKGTFLKEVCRRFSLGNVFTGRAEEIRQRADIVTARALERMRSGPGWAEHLLTEGGVLACWINLETLSEWRSRFNWLSWREPAVIPGTERRCIALAVRTQSVVSQQDVPRGT
jgi:16S rRNA (guanine527-N7)-methyltransferase